jgi:hypothetical protein
MASLVITKKQIVTTGHQLVDKLLRALDVDEIDDNVSSISFTGRTILVCLTSENLVLKHIQSGFTVTIPYSLWDQISKFVVLINTSEEDPITLIREHLVLAAYIEADYLVIKVMDTINNFCTKIREIQITSAENLLKAFDHFRNLKNTVCDIKIYSILRIKNTQIERRFTGILDDPMFEYEITDEDGRIGGIFTNAKAVRRRYSEIILQNFLSDTI